MTAGSDECSEDECSVGVRRVTEDAILDKVVKKFSLKRRLPSRDLKGLSKHTNLWKKYPKQRQQVQRPGGNSSVSHLRKG